MTADGDPTNIDHTLVCSCTEADRQTEAFSSGYCALFRDHLDRDPRTMTAIAEIVGLSPRQFARILRGDAPLRIEMLAMLNDLLGIDASRALIAVGVLGDWRRYNDVNLAVIIQLLDPMLRRLDAEDSTAIEPLTQSAANQVGGWVADLIISNAEQIRRRRETIEDLPELRHLIRRRRDCEDQR